MTMTKQQKVWHTTHGVLFYGDCLEVLPTLPEHSVDLVVGSPPYEDKRIYDPSNPSELTGQGWVDWMVQVVKACLRVSKGMVILVVGHGDHGARRWSGVPALLTADLLRSGIVLRNPLLYHRIGVSGSGHSDWFRADYEWTICACINDEKLHWSDNKAMGSKRRYRRVIYAPERNREGKRLRKIRPGLYVGKDEIVRKQVSVPLEIANPGNVVFCKAGGGRLGSKIAHESVAPYSIDFPYHCIKSFVPPGGVVLDPFMGSGTTLDAAIKTGRRFIGIDSWREMIDVQLRRAKEAELTDGFGLHSQ